MLTLTRLRISPELLMCLVPSVLPKTSCRIVSALVSLCYLVDSIIPVFLSFLIAFELRSCLGVERQSHEDSVEPYLIGIDSLMPEHPFLGAWLVLKLFEDGLHAFENAWLRIELIEVDEEMTGAAVVKVEVLILVTSNCAVGCNHLVGISLAIVED